MANAQTYYGQNDFGKIEIINDSNCVLSFSHVQSAGYDTCSYKKHGDTVFISTPAKVRYRVIPSKEHICANIDTSLWIYTVVRPYAIIKKYRYEDYKGQYICVEEYAAAYDDVKGIFILNDCPIKTGDIIVVYNFWYSRFLYIGEECNNFIIQEDYTNEMCSTFFDNFPLLIKGSKLIPIDKEKNKQCWIDNGFYFPTLKISKKRKSYKTVFFPLIGLSGLPNEKCYDGKPYYATGL
jgi:hypothetical protein